MHASLRYGPAVRAARPVALGTLGAVGLALAACGGQERVNAPRPPAPVTLSAAILRDRVLVSPRAVGAGPLVLVVANQSARRRTLTVETDEIAGTEVGLRASSDPIAPGGTATLELDARRGRYRVGAGDAAIRPARVRVGRRRPSAQDALLLP
jgi:hypothetical protein